MNLKTKQAFMTTRLLMVQVLPVCLLTGCLLIGLISLSAAAVVMRHPARNGSRRREQPIEVVAWAGRATPGCLVDRGQGEKRPARPWRD